MKRDSSRPGMLEVGPAWITAIATIITALTGAGFFAGRVTAPDIGTSSAPTVTAASPAVHVEPGKASSEKTGSSSTSLQSPRTLPLIQAEPIDNGSNAPSVAPEEVNAQQYQQTLEADTLANECSGRDQDSSGADASSTYELNREYQKFHVTIGLADSTPSGDTATFSFQVDGQPVGPTPTVGVGVTQSININVTGALRITLEEYCTATNLPPDMGMGGYVTAVWINPVAES